MFGALYRRIFLVSTVILIYSDSYAQPQPDEEESVDSAETVSPESKKVYVAPPVEAGPGGAIKLEEKRRTKAETLFEWHTHLLWESRYVSQGRDNLSGNSLVSISSEFVVGEVNFVPWYAYSHGADYSELNLNFVYGVRPTKNTAVYFGYNHIRARSLDERENDNEVSLGLVHKLLKRVGVAASVYHSFEADGSFIELTAKYFDSLNKKVGYSVQGGLGVNAGYIPDGHDGLNHFQLRANATYYPFEQTELYAYAGYNTAIDRDAVRYQGDELLGDFFWGGTGFVYLF